MNVCRPLLPKSRRGTVAINPIWGGGQTWLPFAACSWGQNNPSRCSCCTSTSPGSLLSADRSTMREARHAAWQLVFVCLLAWPCCQASVAVTSPAGLGCNSEHLTVSAAAGSPVAGCYRKTDGSVGENGGLLYINTNGGAVDGGVGRPVAMWSLDVSGGSSQRPKAKTKVGAPCHSAGLLPMPVLGRLP